MVKRIPWIYIVPGSQQIVTGTALSLRNSIPHLNHNGNGTCSPVVMSVHRSYSAFWWIVKATPAPHAIYPEKYSFASIWLRFSYCLSPARTAGIKVYQVNLGANWMIAKFIFLCVRYRLKVRNKNIYPFAFEQSFPNNLMNVVAFTKSYLAKTYRFILHGEHVITNQKKRCHYCGGEEASKRQLQNRE